MEGGAAQIAVSGWAVAAFVGYLALVVAIGFLSARFSSAGIGEFFVGGRRMNRIVVALSAVVSGRSAWLLLGVTGMAWTMGFAAVWAVVGYTVVELILFLGYAVRLRRFAEVHDCITLPDFFEARFGDPSGRLRLTLSAVILVFMVAYVAAQLVGGGKAIGVSFGLDPAVGVALTAAVVLGYTVVGGFLAVSLTDSVQAVFMIVSLVVLPVLAIGAAGGWPGVAAQLSAADPLALDPFSLGAGALLGLVGIGLGSPGSPHILVRYMSIRRAEALRFAAVVGTFWNVVMGAGAVFIGLAGRIYFPTLDAIPGADPENVYPALAQSQLPPALFGVVVASVFAAIMSTADSQLLVAASAVVRDVYERVLRRGETIPQERLVRISRWVVTALVGAALILGILAQNLVFWLVLFAWAGLGAAFGPTSILALYWRGTTRAGVYAGLAVGTATTFVWYLTPFLKERLYELIPAFALATLATVLVSRWSPAPPGVEEMFQVMEGKRGEE